MISNTILKQSYIYIPIIAFLYKYGLGNQYTKYFFDIQFFIITLIFIACSFDFKIKLNKNLLVIPVLGFGMLFCLLLSNLLSSFYETVHTFYFWPFIMSIKLPIYFISIGFFVSAFKAPSIHSFLKLSRFVSFFVIADFSIRYFIINGHVVRPSIVSEINYDAIFILLGLCSLLILPKNKFFYLDLLLISIAIILTQSKTSIGCFFILSIFYLVRFNDIRSLIFIFVFFFFGFYTVLMRMSVLENYINLDRFQMLLSFIQTINDARWDQLLFGFSPGFPLRDYDDHLTFFIGHLVEPLNAEGVHSFIFHSMWFRMITDYGLISFGLFIVVILLAFLRIRPLRPFIVLISLQGVTMGVFYLSVCVIILMIYIRSCIDHSSFSIYKGIDFEYKACTKV